MIFTDDFIKVLCKFAKINPAMYFREGTVQTTIALNSGNATMFFTRAYTDVNIVEPFAIGQLGKLIGVLKTFNSPEIIVEPGKMLVIKDENKQVNFVLSVPEHINYHKNPDKITIPEGYEATLTHTNIDDINQYYSLFKSENVSFVGKDGKFLAVVSTVSNPQSDHAEIVLGETTAEFNAVLDAANFRLEPDMKSKEVFKIRINKKGLVFIGNEKLEYYLPVIAKVSSF